MFEKYSRLTIILALTCALLVGCKSSGSDTAAVAAPDTGGTTPPPAPNTPPVISSPGNQTSDVNESVRLPLSASDADQDTLSFSASGLPAGLDIDSSSGVISGAATSAGVSTVTINVSDGSDSDSASFSWTVSAVQPPPATNSAPVLSNPGDQTSDVNASVSLSLNASDADGDTLSFSASGLPAGLDIDSSSGVISGAATSAGLSAVTVTVSDGADSDSASFSWTVSEAAPPTLGSVTLSWTPPTQNEDGSPLEDLAGYNIYYGIEQGNYPTKIPIDNPGLSTYVVDELAPNTYYFVATSQNSAGIESAYSNIAVKTVPTP